MRFSPALYGPAAQPFLSGTAPASRLAALSNPARLFPGAQFPREAVAGLWLLLGDLDRSHQISQELASSEAAFWHGIMHRREPDAANAAYWFRRVGKHSVFPALHSAAIEVGYDAARRSADWDPFAWIEFWDRARRRPDSAEYRVASEVQRVEWEILFDHCARPVESKSNHE